MNELRPLPVWAGLARFTPAKIFILISHLSVAKLTQKWILGGVFCPGTFFYTHLQPYTVQNRKKQFSVGKLPKGLKKQSTVHQTCSKNLNKYFGRSVGPYPFGIFGIRPKLRSRRRFENLN